MEIKCVWEHNGNDTLLYAVDFPGAFTRGKTQDIALSKMPQEIYSYAAWAGLPTPEIDAIVITQNSPCQLQVCDADSDVLFDAERTPMTMSEYRSLKQLVLKSATDFNMLYSSVPDPRISDAEIRNTFYGQVPRTAEEMYLHTKSVNDYYFGEIGVDADHEGDILNCRLRGFEQLEQRVEFLKNESFEGSYGECWTLRKMMRRFIWHDRIHAKAMYKMAIRIWGKEKICDPYHFDEGTTPSLL